MYRYCLSTHYNDLLIYDGFTYSKSDPNPRSNKWKCSVGKKGGCQAYVLINRENLTIKPYGI